MIFVHEPKKNFIKKFLYEPFPVESQLPEQLHDHFNAEIVAGTIRTRQVQISHTINFSDMWTYVFCAVGW